MTDRTLATQGASRDLDSLSTTSSSGESSFRLTQGGTARTRSEIDSLVRRLQAGPAQGRAKPNSNTGVGVGGPRSGSTIQLQSNAGSSAFIGAASLALDLTDPIVSLPQTAPEPTEELLARRLAGAEFVILPNTDLGYRIAKRTVDIVGALILMVLGAPVFILLVLLIRFDSPGPALFRQTRVTRNGKHFTFYKFRTMFVDARERFPEFYEMAPLRADEDAFYKLEDDPRNTRVGAWLRRTTLDEIPNLFNVLKGDISLVGPRPDLPDLVRSYTDLELSCLLTKAGITGTAQTRGRSLLTVRERLKLDLYYVSHQSLWLDCKLLIRTVLVVLVGRGAF